MKKQHTLWASLVLALLLAGCDESNDPDPAPLVVNSLEDLAAPPSGVVTLRSALAKANGGRPIVFDARLDGGTIELSIIGEEHTVLMGEVMEMAAAKVGTGRKLAWALCWRLRRPHHEP